MGQHNHHHVSIYKLLLMRDYAIPSFSLWITFHSLDPFSAIGLPNTNIKHCTALHGHFQIWEEICLRFSNLFSFISFPNCLKYFFFLSRLRSSIWPGLGFSILLKVHNFSQPPRWFFLVQGILIYISKMVFPSTNLMHILLLIELY